ncbi:hypothetical protein IAE22_34820, partial [Bacillus sp. S34]|nr:hypothetical protein [Bacillus sp. S34]
GSERTEPSQHLALPPDRIVTAGEHPDHGSGIAVDDHEGPGVLPAGQFAVEGQRSAEQVRRGGDEGR